MWSLLLIAACTSPHTEAWEVVLDEAAESHGAPGLSLAVVRDGELVFTGARGLAALETGTPLGPHDALRLGSITKTVTVALVLQLADEGVLSLEDPVTRWVEDFPFGEAVTLEHLARHTSGLLDWHDHDEDYWAEDTALTVEEALQRSFAIQAEQGLPLNPGADFAYSNTGIMLLGLTVEAATGEPWEDAVRQRISGPLGLSMAPASEVALAAGHEAGHPPTHPHSDNVWAAGSLAGTAADVALFGDALLDGALLSEEGLQALTTRTELTDGERVSYGLGLRVRGSAHGPERGHRGKSIGYRGEWTHLPRLGLTVCVLVNETEAGSVSPVLEQVVEMLASE